MYTDFFQLKEAPFSIAPNPHFLYLSRRHQEALAHLLYSIKGSSGFILLTGEVGTGKTTLSRCLLEQIPEHVDSALIFNPKLTPFELVASICDDLGVTYPEGVTLKNLFDHLNHHLLQTFSNNRMTVLIIDEAQKLSIELLEQIRLLGNLETNTQKLLQIVLIGQPELGEVLARPELRQLSQRITARYHIMPFQFSETVKFVQHRLFVAGCARPIFNRWSLFVIHRAAKGTPRLLNQICDRAMLGAYSRNVYTINAGIARSAIKEVMGEIQRYRPRMSISSVLLLIVLGVVGGLFFSWQMLGDASRSELFNRSGFIALFSVLLADKIEADKIEANKIEVNKTVVTPPVNSADKLPVKTLDKAGVAAVSEQAAPDSQKKMVTTIPAVSAVSTTVAAPIPVADVTLKTSQRITRMARSEFAAPTAQVSQQNTPLTSSRVAKHSLEHLLKITGNRHYQARIMSDYFALWGVSKQGSQSKMNCQNQAIKVGLLCSHLAGNWNALQQLEIPFMVNLKLPGNRYYSLLVIALGEKALKLKVGSKEVMVLFSSIEPYWYGHYLVVWRPTPGNRNLLRTGMSNTDVVWLREGLSRIQKAPIAAQEPMQFDQELEQRFKQFQKLIGLNPDGVAGMRSIIAMDALLKDPRRPLPSLGRIVAKRGG